MGLTDVCFEVVLPSFLGKYTVVGFQF